MWSYRAALPEPELTPEPCPISSRERPETMLNARKGPPEEKRYDELVGERAVTTGATQVCALSN